MVRWTADLPNFFVKMLKLQRGLWAKKLSPHQLWGPCKHYLPPRLIFAIDNFKAKMAPVEFEHFDKKYLGRPTEEGYSPSLPLCAQNNCRPIFWESGCEQQHNGGALGKSTCGARGKKASVLFKTFQHSSQKVTLCTKYLETPSACQKLPLDVETQTETAFCHK